MPNAPAHASVNAVSKTSSVSSAAQKHPKASMYGKSITEVLTTRVGRSKGGQMSIILASHTERREWNVSSFAVGERDL